jgi:hypothetical protein
MAPRLDTTLPVRQIERRLRADLTAQELHRSFGLGLQLSCKFGHVLHIAITDGRFQSFGGCARCVGLQVGAGAF